MGFQVSPRSLLLVGVLALGSFPATEARAQQTTAEAEVKAVVDSFHWALQRGDSTAVLALLAPDAVILESGGAETRDEYRSHHLPADIAFARSVKQTRSPTSVAVRGDVAWTTATSTTRGEYRGQAVNSASVELMVLSRRADGWKIRAIHWSSRNRS